jgi:hypothetical protein
LEHPAQQQRLSQQLVPGFTHIMGVKWTKAHQPLTHAVPQALEQLPTAYTPTMQPTNWKALLEQLAADVAASSRCVLGPQGGAAWGMQEMQDTRWQRQQQPSDSRVAAAAPAASWLVSSSEAGCDVWQVPQGQTAVVFIADMHSHVWDHLLPACTL